VSQHVERESAPKQTQSPYSVLLEYDREHWTARLNHPEDGPAEHPMGLGIDPLEAVTDLAFALAEHHDGDAGRLRHEAHWLRAKVDELQLELAQVVAAAGGEVTFFPAPRGMRGFHQIAVEELYRIHRQVDTKQGSMTITVSALTDRPDQ